MDGASGGVRRVAAVVAGSGGEGLRAFLALLVAGYVAILGFGLLLLVASSQAGRFGAAGFVRALASPLVLAFSTASGAAALPGAMEALERWGASRGSIRSCCRSATAST